MGTPPAQHTSAPTPRARQGQGQSRVPPASPAGSRARQQAQAPGLPPRTGSPTPSPGGGTYSPPRRRALGPRRRLPPPALPGRPRRPSPAVDLVAGVDVRPRAQQPPHLLHVPQRRRLPQPLLPLPLGGRSRHLAAAAADLLPAGPSSHLPHAEQPPTRGKGRRRSAAGVTPAGVRAALRWGTLLPVTTPARGRGSG